MVIVVLLGLFFISSVIWRGISKGEENAVAKETQTTINVTSGQTGIATEETTNKENTNSRPTWKEMVKLMSNDPRMCPAESLTTARDPFLEPKTVLKQTGAEEQGKDKPRLMPPESLGMSLSSTLIGSQGKIARISGRTYKQGQAVEVDKDGRHYKFILDEIRDRQVVLEAEGEHFELSIPDPGKSQRMVFGIGGDLNKQ